MLKWLDGYYIGDGIQGNVRIQSKINAGKAVLTGNKIEFTDADYPANASPEDRFIFKNCDNIKVED